MQNKLKKWHEELHDVDTPENWNNLIEEIKTIVLQHPSSDDINFRMLAYWFLNHLKKVM